MAATRPTLLARCLAIAALTIGIVVAWSFGQELYRRSNPDAAFEEITGRTVPPGVRVTAYRGKINDNFFHKTHYWTLSGSPTALRQVVSGTGLERSDEDARSVLPDLEGLFDLSLSQSDVVAGYEEGTARNHWYWIFSGESTGLYAY